MRVVPDRNMILWLLLLLVVVSLVVYRMAFHVPVPAFDEEAVRNLMVK